MNIEEHKHIEGLTTWHLPHIVRYYTNIQSIEDLQQLRNHPLFLDATIRKIILGKGANSLFTKTQIDALVITIDIKGIQKRQEDNKYSYWEVMAGEDWCEIVNFFVFEQHLSGIENLTLIPGKVGAAPIQNIAAYGQVFEDICEAVYCFNLTSGEMKTFDKTKCNFSYRNSYFKEQIIQGNNNLVVTSVLIKLQKESSLETNYESNYENLQSVLVTLGSPPYSTEQVCQAVAKLRSQKLPSIDKYGTNGSLFMNPIVSGEKLLELLDKFPDMQFYPISKMQHHRIQKADIKIKDHYKIATGHILEKLGWRYKNEYGEWQGKVINQVGVWHKHSLVLVNYGTKDASHILEYIYQLQTSFYKHTEIKLIPEINIF